MLSLPLIHVRLNFVFYYLVVCFFGKSSTFEIKLSSAVFLLGGGIKSLLFLTREISVSSVPSKYSASLSFLLNSFKSSFNCSGLRMGGVGVNFKPLFSKVFSVVLNFLLDKLIILMAFIPVFKKGWGLGVFDLDPSLALTPPPASNPTPTPSPTLT